MNRASPSALVGGVMFAVFNGLQLGQGLFAFMCPGLHNLDKLFLGEIPDYHTDSISHFYFIRFNVNFWQVWSFIWSSYPSKFCGIEINVCLRC